MNNIPKNIQLYIKQLQKIGGITWLVFTAYTVFTKEYASALSATLGLGFSYIILLNLIRTQVMLKETKIRNIVFIRYFSRLFLYGIPIATTLYFKNWFQFSTTLLFLFYFQLMYLALEISTMIQSRKRKLKTK